MASIPTEEYADVDLFDDSMNQPFARSQVSLEEGSDVPHGEPDILYEVPVGVGMHAVVCSTKNQ